jgi:thioesterase DpgC
MIEVIPASERKARLTAGGLPEKDLLAFLAALDGLAFSGQCDAAQLGKDTQRLGAACNQGRALLGKMPVKSKRTPAERAAGSALVHLLADVTWRFMRHHRDTVYRKLTGNLGKSLRVEELAWAGADLLPGILPTQQELRQESTRMQGDKDGLEIQQGLFFGQILSDRMLGTHLCNAMLRPTPEALERLGEFQRSGKVDLGNVKVEAKGETGYLYFHYPRYLNAEDDDTVGPQEVACDLILLHPGLRMGVLRGDTVDHPKYKGRRIFSAGINLTRIYQGKQSYLFYLTRDLGLVNKFYRGLQLSDFHFDEPESTHEKPWVAVVETFAIGGGCQLLLVMDYVIAEAGAYFNLPARKEGIIPGCANLRLPRFFGERIARQGIMFDKTFYVDSPEARLLINEVVPRDRIDAALEQCVSNAIGSGMVSAGGNRKAIRVQTEPLQVFREYMATNAYEQSFCHLSDQLVHNLERHWNAKERKL